MRAPGASGGVPRPGPFARLLLRLALTERERAEVLGELEELWELRLARDGAARAGRWHAREARRAAVRLARHRLWAAGRGRGSGVSRRGAAERPVGSRLDGLAGDVRVAARGWARSPGLALTIVVTVGLGLGASTAMVAVVRASLLDPLPYAGADRLERVYHAVRGNRWPLSVADYLGIEARQTSFEGVAAYATGEGTLLTDAGAERVPVRPVTAGWFDLLGVPLAAGRAFRPEDGEPGAPAVAVVSEAFARRRFGAPGAAVGAPLRLDGEAMTVVGVLAGDGGPLEERHEIFPAMRLATPERKGPFTLTVVGRRRAGVDAAAAESELRAINRLVGEDYAWRDSTTTYGVMPLEAFVVGRVRSLVLVLLGAVGLILLVASTNAAALLTARAIRRRVELATRAAIGASRAHLARLLVVESVVLVFAGVLVAIAVAAAAVGAVRAAGPDLLPRAGHVALDAGSLGVLAALAALSLLLFGLLPAVQLVGAGTRIADRLRAGGRGQSASPVAQRVRRGLVAAQFAIAVPLLAGAALLTATFVRLQAVDPGFDGAGVLAVGIARTEAPGEDPAVRLRFWRDLLERVEALPGVVAAGVNTARPPRGAGNINNFDPLDRPTPEGEAEPLAVWLVASPGYFEAMGIRLAAGRLFDGRDADPAIIPAVVDRAWAEAVFPGQDPLGRRLYEGGCRAPECSVVEVVGVVEDVKYLGLGDARESGVVGTVYVPQDRWLASRTSLFVRVAGGDPVALLAPIRDIVRTLDPGTALADVATADRLVDQALAAPRNIAAIVLGFAAVALALALIGIYGVMSYFAHEHRREIGIRIVLGGRPRRVLRRMVGIGMRPVLAGTAAGLALAVVASRFTEHLLFGVEPGDPITFAAVPAGMLAAALVACAVPAWRATRQAPASVLREE